MLITPLPDDRRGRSLRQATVEIVVPVYNEERTLDDRVRTLRTYLDQHFPFAATVTVADNASTDGTWDIASRLAAQVPGVRAYHLDRKGRGHALKTVWTESTADVVAYMGRRSGDRPRRHPPAGGAPALRAQRPGHRQPAGPRRQGRQGPPP